MDYAAPSWVRGAAVAACLCGGVGIAGLLGWGLGDPTWSISSGIGALFAAAVFEVRPWLRQDLGGSTLARTSHRAGLLKAADLLWANYRQHSTCTCMCVTRMVFKAHECAAAMLSLHCRTVFNMCCACCCCVLHRLVAPSGCLWMRPRCWRHSGRTLVSSTGSVCSSVDVETH